MHFQNRFPPFPELFPFLDFFDNPYITVCVADTTMPHTRVISNSKEPNMEWALQDPPHELGITGQVLRQRQWHVRSQPDQSHCPRREDPHKCYPQWRGRWREEEWVRWEGEDGDFTNFGCAISIKWGVLSNCIGWISWFACWTLG